MNDYKISILFIKERDEKALDFKASNIDALNKIVDEFLHLFGEIKGEKKTLSMLQYYSVELLNKVEVFAFKYKSENPSLNALMAFFRGFTDNEPFFIIPNANPDIDQNIKLDLYNYLRSIIEKRPYIEVKSEIDEIFGETLKTYEIGSIGNVKTFIGNKSNRICRFCHNKTEDGVTFKNRAHAISEGLGNKNAILHEECDTCNDEFSMSIEPDIIKYLSLFRTFFGIKGNGGIKKFTGNNFIFKKDTNLNLSVTIEDEKEDSFDKFQYRLQAGNINFQDVYKALCKYFISVIPSKYLDKFEDTISWIKGKKDENNLPVIAECITYNFFTEQPILNYYIRKDSKSSLPYAIGEFRFTCMMFIFIIPLTKEDTLDFTKEENYKKFWESNEFKFFQIQKGWIHKSFSSNEEKDFVINILMEKENYEKD